MKIVGMLVVGTGEADRYLPRVLDRLEPLCDEIITACNAADKKTRNLLARRTKSYDYSDYEWGKKQHEIKQHFFNRCVVPEDPDWVICVDADEVLDKRFTREKAEELAQRGEIAYEFYCVQLWNDEKHMRIDGLWGNFYNVRYFKLVKGAKAGYKQTPLHCGLAPVYAYRWRTPCEFFFKHYGYIKEEDRKKKVARYNKYDPNAAYKSSEYYDSILDKGKIREFDENKFGQRLKYVPRKISEDKIKKVKQNMKLYRVENKFGKSYVVDEEHVKYHQNRDRIVKIEEISPAETMTEREVEPVKSEEYQCEICGKVCKSGAGLAAHKRSHE